MLSVQDLREMGTAEYWQELATDITLGTLRRMGQPAEMAKLDKAVSRALRRTRHYRLGRALRRHDAWQWTIRTEKGEGVSSEVHRLQAAVLDEVRGAGMNNRIAVSDGPLRVEITRHKPQAVRMADWLRQIERLPDNGFMFAPGVIPGVGGASLASYSLNDPRVAQLLIGGGTGSGKTTLGTAILTTLALLSSPERLGMVVIDPKSVDMSNSDVQRLPHLMMPVITEPTDAIQAVYSVYNEMEQRRSSVRCSNAAGKRWSIPYRVLLYVDELATLVRQDAGILAILAAVAAEGRGLGVHVILATQRPTVDVVPGALRANLPWRACGWVRSPEEARIVTGMAGTGAQECDRNGEFVTVVRSTLAKLDGFALGDADLARVVDKVVDKWRGTNVPRLQIVDNSPAKAVHQPETVEENPDDALLSAIVARAAELGGLDKVSLNEVSRLGEAVEGSTVGRERARRLLKEASEA